MKLKNLTQFCLVMASALAFGACSTTSDKQSSDQSGASAEQGASSEQMSGQSSGMSSDQSSEQQAGSAQQQMSPSQMMAEMALNELHHINQKEIMLSEMAQNKAQSPEIKQTAQKVMQDHQALEKQVETTAKEQKVELTSFSPSTSEKAMMSRLEQLSGQQFDQAYAQTMLHSHQMATQQLKMTRKQVKNPQITSLIDQAMPKISQHTQASKKAKQAAGQAASSESSMHESP